MCNTCVMMGFTVKINLFKYKRFKGVTQGVATKKNLFKPP